MISKTLPNLEKNVTVKLGGSIHSLQPPLAPPPRMQDFYSSFLCWVLVRREESRGGGRENNWLMFPLKHVTSARLTAENNLGLQASGRLTQTLPLLSMGGGGGLKTKQLMDVS